MSASTRRALLGLMPLLALCASAAPVGIEDPPISRAREPRDRFLGGRGGEPIVPEAPREPTQAEIDAEQKRARKRARNLALAAKAVRS